MSATAAESSDTKLCPDWVWLNNSDVSVARDRGWFKTYTPFHSTVHYVNSLKGTTAKKRVLGVGTVEIPTKRDHFRTGTKCHGTILLKDVLHVPSAITNAFGMSVLRDGYSVQYGGGEPDKWKGTVTDSDGQVQGFFDPRKELFVVKLRGPPAGPEVDSSWIDAQGKSFIYLPSFKWPSTERLKWDSHQSATQSSQPAPRKNKPSPKNEAKFKDAVKVENAGKVKHAAHGNETKTKQQRSKPNECPPYTAAEKAFRKSEWRTEYHFLLHHRLRICHEEDREEGRLVLRAMIVDKVAEDEDEDDDQLEGYHLDCNFTFCQLFWIEKHYGNAVNFMRCHGLKYYVDDDVKEAELLVRTLRTEEAKEMADGSDEQDDADSYDGESDDDQLEGHQVDYNFTRSELDWIEKHYNNAVNFMICYGLKFYDDEDLDEAKTIVKGMMQDDEDEEE